MCSVSDQFKLCTCDNAALKNAPAFWKLFSRQPESASRLVVLGELKSPPPIDLLQDEQNQVHILRRLSEPDVFDFQPNLKTGDLLVLFFRSTQPGFADREYSFRFSSGKWKASDMNYFDRKNDYRTKRKGVVQNPE